MVTACVERRTQGASWPVIVPDLASLTCVVNTLVNGFAIVWLFENQATKEATGGQL